jgi:hypothetical protein
LRGSGKPRQEKPVYRKFRVSLRPNNWALINTKEKEMTAHKHAAAMALYAQDAAETDMPWRRWETNPGGQWMSFDGSPEWDVNQDYRRKPRTIRIGERDVPEPMRIAPAIGSKYWCVRLIATAGVAPESWDGGTWDCDLLARGLCHTTKEAAIAHAEALILVSGGSL